MNRSVLSFADLNPNADNYATQAVDRLLEHAVARGASDLHLESAQKKILARLRVDGSLTEVGELADGATTSVLGRVKALARLVTYRNDIPQEGRMILPDRNLEARVGTLPTLHGERAVIRLAGRQALDWLPGQLGLPDELLGQLENGLESSSGVILVTGPAGSGKTTTAYACLRRLLSQTSTPRSLVSLEDPIEAELPGVSQSQINPANGYGWSDGLKALLRQDPEVTFVGEIRDPETAAVVFQAALTGQLVISTMHARCSADAIRRLLDMQVPVHHLQSGLNLLICQRLLRCLCDCQTLSSEPPTGDGGPGRSCSSCDDTGYRGRLLLAESLPRIEGELARAIFQDADSGQLDRIAQALGMRSLTTLGNAACEAGRIDSAELKRHFTSAP